MSERWEALVSLPPLPVELKILDPRLREWGFPRWGSELAAGLDIHACLDGRIELAPGEQALISAGFSIHAADPDWCAMIYPRSGQGHNNGLVMGNGVGVIDADYQGPIMISAVNRRLLAYPARPIINPGDRIAQMVFHRITRPSFVEVREFSGASERGAGAFGSTGT